MNLDPHLGRSGRIESLLGGAGLVTWALLGGFDQMWARVVMLVFGLILVAGGAGGL